MMPRILYLFALVCAFVTACSSMDSRLSYQITGEQDPVVEPGNAAMGVKAAAPTFNAEDPVP